MHNSAQRIIVIDCQTADLSAAAAFWADALGGTAKIDPDGKYAHIDGQGGRMVLLQAVNHTPRVHLDIEADDQAAEVARLEGLGAHVVDRVKTWTVMEAPTGHRFCVVNPQNAEFAQFAKSWS